MSYLLDTNVISELVRIKTDKNVVKWFDAIPSKSLHISVLTLGEIRKGIEKLQEPKRKEKLRIWLEYELPAWFEDRILPINQAVADKWGWLQSQVQRTIPAIDSLIAATALHYDLQVVSRNTKDFNYPFLLVVNPWE